MIDLLRYSEFVDALTSTTTKNMDEYVTRLNDLHAAGLNISVLDAATSGMCGESGELMEIVKKLKFHNKDLTDEVRAHMTKELGDVIFYWMMCCQAMKLDANDVIAANVDKLQARYPEGEFSVSRSETRAEGDI
jgi:NTP pyrophosphatase (non-canonical NTP hydrolase)